MIEQHREASHRQWQLESPTRNNYFYGKLLDVFHLEMEQNYFNRKRWLLNRLGLGTGVLCGLEVEVMSDGESILVKPGVAIDALGRLIIVPRDDDHLKNQELKPGDYTLCLAYHECQTEPVPVLVGDCDTAQTCAPSTIRERYEISIRPGSPKASPDQQVEEQCRQILLSKKNFVAKGRESHAAYRQALYETLETPCITSVDPCVILATIHRPPENDAPLVVDPFAYRSTIYSNAKLLDLLLCLAEQVDHRNYTLQYVRGSGQEAEPEATLELQARVVSGKSPIENEPVTFRILEGGGQVRDGSSAGDEISVKSDTEGLTTVQWTLGLAGSNSIAATISSGFQLVFYATVKAPEKIRILRYVGGDGQAAYPGEILDKPLEIEVVDEKGNPIPKEKVRFRVRAGAGAVAGPGNNDPTDAEVSVSTDSQGQAGVIWKLGPATGLNITEASIDASCCRVVFHALALGKTSSPADPPVEVKNPVITKIEPENSSKLTLATWQQQNFQLKITFNREMNEEQLKKPDLVAEWLRVWMLIYDGKQMDSVGLKILNIEGNSVIYGVAEPQRGRYLVQIWAQDENIVDTSTPPVLLDADFSGSDFVETHFQQIWEWDPQAPAGSPVELWDALTDNTAPLPDIGSGNGEPGGQFHSWFEVVP